MQNGRLTSKQLVSIYHAVGNPHTLSFGSSTLSQPPRELTQARRQYPAACPKALKSPLPTAPKSESLRDTVLSPRRKARGVSRPASRNRTPRGCLGQLIGGRRADVR
jgi:hypothetical protein